MKQAAEAGRSRPAPAAWPRRALVGLWVVAFVLAGVGIASRWDSLVTRLARPPVGDTAGSASR